MNKSTDISNQPFTARHDTSDDDETSRARALLSLSIALVDSAVDILENHVQTDEQLVQDSALLPGGTLGKHFRHVIETFQAFLRDLYPPLVTQPSLPVINYDETLPIHRRPVARSLKECRRSMRTISHDLQAWGKESQQTSRPRSQRSEIQKRNPAALGLEGHGESKEGSLAAEMARPVKVIAITPTKQEMSSTVGRELWYISLHAIHHFSMLRTIAVYELNLDFPVEFGTAPSTLLYRGLAWKPPMGKKDVKIIRTSKL